VAATAKLKPAPSSAAAVPTRTLPDNLKADAMPIHTIAQYRLKKSGVEKVKRAIEEYLPYIRAHEPGTRVYAAWQQEDDPTRFVHFFIFEDKAAHTAHANSEARNSRLHASLNLMAAPSCSQIM
jgi:quinol monooxygenase YgiN